MFPDYYIATDETLYPARGGVSFKKHVNRSETNC